MNVNKYLLFCLLLMAISCNHIPLYRVKYKVFVQQQKNNKDTIVITFSTRDGCKRLNTDSTSWDTIIGPVREGFPAYLCAESVSKENPKINLCIHTASIYDVFLPKRWRGNKGYVRTIYYTGHKL